MPGHRGSWWRGREPISKAPEAPHPCYSMTQHQNEQEGNEKEMRNLEIMWRRGNLSL